MLHPFRRIRQWFFSRLPNDVDRLTLNRHRIYILPTRQGYWYAVILLLMLLGSINYGASLGFMLTFLLAGMGKLSILYTFRNLQKLEIRIGAAQPVFAGETARFPVQLRSHSGRACYDVAIGDDPPQRVNVPAAAVSLLQHPVPTTRRGLQPTGRILVATDFPLGLFRAWAWFQPDCRAIVYPRPISDSAPMPPPVGGDRPSRDGRVGQDDLIGLRRYRPGDPIKRIAWRSLAKGLPLQSLEYQGDDESELMFDWQRVPQADVESKLEQICRWILDADEAGLQYGVRLPGLEIPLGHGPDHRRNCLEHLARFES